MRSNLKILILLIKTQVDTKKFHEFLHVPTLFISSNIEKYALCRIFKASDVLFSHISSKLRFDLWIHNAIQCIVFFGAHPHTCIRTLRAYYLFNFFDISLSGRAFAFFVRFHLHVSSFYFVCKYIMHGKYERVLHNFTFPFVNWNDKILPLFFCFFSEIESNRLATHPNIFSAGDEKCRERCAIFQTIR